MCRVCHIFFVRHDLFDVILSNNLRNEFLAHIESKQVFIPSNLLSVQILSNIQSAQAAGAILPYLHGCPKGQDEQQGKDHGKYKGKGKGPAKGKDLCPVLFSTWQDNCHIGKTSV